MWRMDVGVDLEDDSKFAKCQLSICPVRLAHRKTRLRSENWRITLLSPHEYFNRWFIDEPPCLSAIFCQQPRNGDRGVRENRQCRKSMFRAREFRFRTFQKCMRAQAFCTSKMSDIWDIWVIHQLKEKSRIFICRFCLYVCQNRARGTISSRGSSGTDCTDCTDLHYLELPGASPFEFSSSSIDVLAFNIYTVLSMSLPMRHCKASAQPTCLSILLLSVTHLHVCIQLTFEIQWPVSPTTPSETRPNWRWMIILRLFMSNIRELA